MKYIISGTNFKQVDKYTINTVGIPSLVLMERAAVAVSEVIADAKKNNTKVMFFCGTGNNGADGIAVARILCNKGYSTCIYIVGDTKKATEEFNTQLKIYKNIGGTVSDSPNVDADMVVDAIFGIGISRDVKGLHEEIIHYINSLNKPVYSVDIPSGINADTGKVMNVAVKADVTVTFGVNKSGLVFYPGADYAGKVIVADIGFPGISYAQVEKYLNIENSDLALIPKRQNSSNKGTYGKALIVAGSRKMTGAAFMCACACLRMGVGMVKILTPVENEFAIKTMLPEAMVTTYDDTDYMERLKEELKWCSVVVIGPGIGTGKNKEEMVKFVLEAKIPCVLDADAINCMSDNRELCKLLHKNVIITPHMGEMSRFTGIPINNIKENIIDVAKDTAKRYNINVVLKDARTVISDGKAVYINTSGNNGMSTAGSGDVLAGIVTALTAKDMDNILAAALAVFIHGMAGDMAADKKSRTAIIATDLLEEIIGITKLI